jgi:predicted RNA-binding Zn-ribbon protein involved in translation (DUF1610 family)
MMYCTPPETRKAQKVKTCMNCGEAINVGDEYKRWMCIIDGKGSTNFMHPECLDDLCKAFGSGYFEYTLYSVERPQQQNAEG